jgi:hypothetical protein
VSRDVGPDSGTGAGDVAAGINRIEGYLLAERERVLARAEAEEFADGLPWLLSSQRDDVVRRYTDARIDAARRRLEAIAQRCGELREEYAARYALLRARCVAATAAVVVLVVGIDALTRFHR